ncbi:MAG: helix-turn-helix transcriptional regulator [Desulfatibacillum sp.]|nr:helix-turn-helix transcriptional regulator [Desulfatibacillum sp.]
MKHRTKTGLPPQVAAHILQLGERVRIARKRRGLTMAEMASRMYVSRLTLTRLEKGEPGISLSVLATGCPNMIPDKTTNADPYEP